MQSEHAISSVDVGITGSAGARMTPELVVVHADDPDTSERWLAWRARGAKLDRATAQTMTRLLVAIILAMSMWLVFQLLS